MIRFAKEQGIAAVLVGHVTKDGAIAGPKTLEHMVDVVLYLEGEGDRGLRALRGWKNRFGPTHVAGLFEMSQDGLVEVADPSRAFLAEWESSVPGTVVFPTIDGRRPVLVEVQALVSPGEFARRGAAPVASTPSGSTNCWRCSTVTPESGSPERRLHRRGRRADAFRPGDRPPGGAGPGQLAAGRALGPMAAWGEVGLTGEVRQVPLAARRLEEAERVGARVLAPSDGSRLRLPEALEAAGLSGSVRSPGGSDPSRPRPASATTG